MRSEDSVFGACESDGSKELDAMADEMEKAAGLGKGGSTKLVARYDGTFGRTWVFKYEKIGYVVGVGHSESGGYSWRASRVSDLGWMLEGGTEFKDAIMALRAADEVVVNEATAIIKLMEKRIEEIEEGLLNTYFTSDLVDKFINVDAGAAISHE